jgi:5,10-methylenetetrahydromethanopterin reductase
MPLPSRAGFGILYTAPARHTREYLEVLRPLLRGDLADGTIAMWVRPDTIADYLVPRLGDGARVAVLALVAVTADPDGVRETIARDYAGAGDLPAYRAMLDRGGLAGPADTVVAGDEATVLREVTRFRDAGVTDLIVSPLGTQEEQSRVLEVVRG